MDKTNQTLSGSTNNAEKYKKFTGFEILEVLRWLDDLVVGSQAQYVLLGELPYKLINSNELSITDPNEIRASGIEIGIKKNSWNEVSKGLFRTFLLENKMDHGMDLTDPINFTYNGIPITIRIIDKNYNFLKNPDFVNYGPDRYLIPNPFDKYWKARFIIK